MTESREIVDHILIDETGGSPIEALATLMDATGLDPEPDGGLAGIDDQLQKHWLKKSVAGRHEITGSSAPQLVQTIWETANQIGLTAEREPSQKSYRFVLIGGALMKMFLKRTRFVIDYSITGTPYGLGSKKALIDKERSDLSDTLEMSDADIESLTIQAEGMAAVVKNVDFSCEVLTSEDRPTEGEDINPTRPANLGETIADFKEHITTSSDWQDGEIAVVSSAPFYGSGILQASLSLPSDTTIDIVGPKISEVMQGRPPAVLDELARMFHNELLRIEKDVKNCAKIRW